MAISILNDKAQEAWKSYLLGFSAIAVPIYTGKGNDDKALNCIIVECNGEGDEYIAQTGNYWVHSMISLKHKAVPNEDGQSGENPKPDALDMLALLGDAINANDLAMQLSSNADDFTVQGVLYDAPDRSQDENGFWIDTFNVRLLSCCSDL